MNEDVQRLDALIRQHAPALKPTTVPGMGGEMFGYGIVPYQTKSMKEPGEWPLLALKQQKRYISLYVCALVDGQYMAERYAPELGKASCGKSCIRFKRLSDLDETVLVRLIEEVNDRHVAGEKLFGQ